MTRQVALVTGSSRGIGLCTAVELARAGFAIAVNGPSTGTEIDNATETIAAFGVPVHRAVFDVSDVNIHEKMIEQIEDALGPLTTLINNAGVGVISRGDPLEVTVESYDRCMAVNARPVFFLSQKFAQGILANRRSPDLHYSIVNVTSANAIAVAEPRAEYCASKAAAAMISKTFAVRLGRENIAVYDVQPGLIETGMTKPVIGDYQLKAEEGLCLLPRVGQPEEVGKVIASLATGQLPYTTGQVISVDGGMLVSRF